MDALFKELELEKQRKENERSQYPPSASIVRPSSVFLGDSQALGMSNAFSGSDLPKEVQKSDSKLKEERSRLT